MVGSGDGAPETAGAASPAPVASPGRRRARAGLVMGVVALGVGVAAWAALGGRNPGERRTSQPALAAPRAATRGVDLIDVHVHVSPTGLPRLLDVMRRRGMSHAINLSGGQPGAGLEEQLDAAADAAGKIIVF